MDKRSVLDQKCLLYGGQYIYGEKTLVGLWKKSAKQYLKGSLVTHLTIMNWTLWGTGKRCELASMYSVKANQRVEPVETKYFGYTTGRVQQKLSISTTNYQWWLMINCT